MGQWSSIRSSVTQANPIICLACGLEPLLFKTHVFPPSFDNKSHDQTVGFSLNITMESSSYSFPGFTHSVMSDSLWPHGLQLEASLSITNSRSPPKLMSTESVMPSSHLILCRPLLLPPSVFPSIRVFSNESLFASGGQSIGVSASASVLPMNIPMKARNLVFSR